MSGWRFLKFDRSIVRPPTSSIEQSGTVEYFIILISFREYGSFNSYSMNEVNIIKNTFDVLASPTIFALGRLTDIGGSMRGICLVRY